MMVLFKRRYRVKQKGSLYVLQSFCIFRWIDLDSYSDIIRANAICNGMTMQNKDSKWRYQ